MEHHDPDGALVNLRDEVSTELVLGKLFGKPCLKHHGKAVAAMFHGNAVFKLHEVAAALSLDGAHLWDPSGKGKPMKAWVVVPQQHRERWPELARTAMATPST